jgi:hypothetical protein
MVSKPQSAVVYPAPRFRIEDTVERPDPAPGTAAARRARPRPGT